jgi:hypothetical protein
MWITGEIVARWASKTLGLKIVTGDNADAMVMAIMFQQLGAEPEK